jgi:hypothetical protein
MQELIGRQSLVEADLRCLMCSRPIGQLAGLVGQDRSQVSWTTFRSATPSGPHDVELTGFDRLHCRHCGGAAVMEDVSVTVVRDKLRAVA